MDVSIFREVLFNRNILDLVTAYKRGTKVISMFEADIARIDLVNLFQLLAHKLDFDLLFGYCVLYNSSSLLIHGIEVKLWDLMQLQKKEASIISKMLSSFPQLKFKSFLTFAAKNGNQNLTQELLKKNFSQSCPILYGALFTDNEEFLRWVNMVAPVADITNEMLEIALDRGSVEGIRFLLQLGYNRSEVPQAEFEKASKLGNISLLQYLFKSKNFLMSGMNNDRNLCAVIKGGNFEMSKWMIELNLQRIYWRIPTQALESAAQSGNFELFLFVNDRVNATSKTIVSATEGGNLDIIKWIMETSGVIPGNGNALYSAIVKNQVEIVQYFLLCDSFREFTSVFSKKFKMLLKFSIERKQFELALILIHHFKTDFENQATVIQIDPECLESVLFCEERIPCSYQIEHWDLVTKRAIANKDTKFLEWIFVEEKGQVTDPLLFLCTCSLPEAQWILQMKDAFPNSITNFECTNKWIQYLVVNGKAETARFLYSKNKINLINPPILNTDIPSEFKYSHFGTREFSLLPLYLSENGLLECLQFVLQNEIVTLRKKFHEKIRSVAAENKHFHIVDWFDRLNVTKHTISTPGT
jgi:hypothetical protein